MNLLQRLSFKHLVVGFCVLALGIEIGTQNADCIAFVGTDPAIDDFVFAELGGKAPDAILFDQRDRCGPGLVTDQQSAAIRPETFKGIEDL